MCRTTLGFTAEKLTTKVTHLVIVQISVVTVRLDLTSKQNF